MDQNLSLSNSVVAEKPSSKRHLFQKASLNEVIYDGCVSCPTRLRNCTQTFAFAFQSIVKAFEKFRGTL